MSYYDGVTVNPFSLPNLDVEARRQVLFAVQGVVVVLATLAVIGRFVSRRVRHLPFQADDWTIAAALAGVWALFVITIQGQGLATPFFQQPVSSIQALESSIYAFTIAYALTPPMVKLSLCLLYQRIFVQKVFRWTVWALISIVAASMVITTFMAIFLCSPISAFWDLTTPGTCLNVVEYLIWLASVNIVTDLVVWIVPIPMVWRLHMNWRQKLLLTSIFGLGFFALVSSIMRLVYGVLFFSQTASVLFIPDFAYCLWSVIEPAVGIICACLPILRALFDRDLSWQRKMKRFVRETVDRTQDDSGSNLENKTTPPNETDTVPERSWRSHSPLPPYRTNLQANDRQDFTELEAIHVSHEFTVQESVKK